MENDPGKENFNMAGKVREICPLLFVFDMPESLRFYCDILGFELVESAGPADDIGWVLLKHGNTWLMLNTLYEVPDRPALPDPSRTTAHGDTSLYFASPYIDEIYQHMKSAGVELTEPNVTGYGFRAIDFKDPDGYTIVFHWRVE